MTVPRTLWVTKWILYYLRSPGILRGFLDSRLVALMSQADALETIHSFHGTSIL